MKFGRIKVWATGVACALLSVAGASALTINDDNPYVIGTVEGLQSPTIAQEAAAVNILLGMGINSSQTVDGDTYTRGDNPVLGSGSVSGGTKDDSGGLSGSGFEYVIAKYDGPNAGSVVFYFGGAAFTLPADGYSIWGNEGQYALSHWTGFNGPGTGPGPGPGVPDAGSTLALIGLAVTGLGLLRRKLS